ncbi:Ceramide synthase 1, partial [Blomia tropicalis]
DEQHSRNPSAKEDESYIDIFARFNPTIVTDICWVLFGAFMFTLVRYLLTNIVIKFMFKYELLNPKNKKRFMESMYSCIFYMGSFYVAYSIEQKEQYLKYPLRLWQGFTFADTMPSLVQFLYFMEVSHYIHSSYAVFFVNQWIHLDSIIMFIHHIFALLLLAISYLTKMHRVAVLIVYLFDICDIIMEFGKCLLKLQLTRPIVIKMVEMFKIICFGNLIFFWFFFRLYQFPLKVIHSAAVCFTHNPIELWFPLSITLYSLLLLLFLLNLYWGLLLLRVLFKALIGGTEEIEDIRDADIQSQRHKNE